MPASLRLEDYSDIEFLHLVVDAGDDERWAASSDVAALAGISHPHPLRCVAMRCAWLWRYGALEREQATDDEGQPIFVAGDKQRPKWTQRWRLSHEGEALVGRELTMRERDRLDSLAGSNPLHLTRELTQIVRANDPTASWLMRREWKYGTHRNRNGRVR